VNYIDTSCLLKILRTEPLSADVRRAIAMEPEVMAELETLVQLKAVWTGGGFTRAQWRKLKAELALLRNQPPFEFRTLPSAVFQTALRQHRNLGGLHCRSLDRLHLAAMEVLKVSRLMTHDEGQAKAASEMGFEVVRPGGVVEQHFDFQIRVCV
jgi:predicted nucleic acid-binding protein